MKDGAEALVNQRWAKLQAWLRKGWPRREQDWDRSLRRLQAKLPKTLGPAREALWRMGSARLFRTILTSDVGWKCLVVWFWDGGRVVNWRQGKTAPVPLLKAPYNALVTQWLTEQGIDHFSDPPCLFIKDVRTR